MVVYLGVYMCMYAYVEEEELKSQWASRSVISGKESAGQNAWRSEAQPRHYFIHFMYTWQRRPTSKMHA